MYRASAHHRYVIAAGYMPGKMTMLLMNLHASPRPIYMSRHGESFANMEGKIGGDSGLTPSGHVYAKVLAQYIQKLHPPRSKDDDSCESQEDDELVVWTSTMQRTAQTVSYMLGSYECVKWKALDEINAGEPPATPFASKPTVAFKHTNSCGLLR